MRYPTALDLPPSEALGADAPPSSTPNVSIDRSLFRRLRRRPSAPAEAPKEPIASKPPGAYRPPARPSTAEGKHRPPTRGAQELEGAIPMAGRRRLAGNGLEGPLFPNYYDDEDYSFSAFCGIGPPLGSSDDAALAETPGWAEPVARPFRATSSPGLRSHNAWLQDGSPARGQHRGPPARDRELREARPSSADEEPGANPDAQMNLDLLQPREPGDVYPYLDDARWRPPPFFDDGGPLDYLGPGRGSTLAWEGAGAWLTPRRRRLAKSDPVRRGAELRNLWSRDRFLRSTSHRKFNLRGCGPPREASPPHRSRRLFSGYVPPHQKRRDDLRCEVRRQMRETDFY